MGTLEVDIETFTDVDFILSQTGPFANGLATIGSNPVHVQVRSIATDPTIWVEAGTENANVFNPAAAFLVTITTGPPDVIAIRFPQTVLVNLPPGTYVYSAIMSSVNGTVRSELFRGAMTHNAGPTMWPSGTP